MEEEKIRLRIVISENAKGFAITASPLPSQLGCKHCALVTARFPNAMRKDVEEPSFGLLCEHKTFPVPFKD